jgi:hypothetical protein
MTNAATFIDEAIAATKIDFTKSVDAIDSAIIELADTTINTYNIWSSRIKQFGLALYYPTGSVDWKGRVETIEKTNRGIRLNCRGQIQHGFDTFIDTDGVLWEGLVASTVSKTVTIDTALTASQYVGMGISFDDLTPPEDVSAWITASAITKIEYCRTITGSTATYSYTTITASTGSLTQITSIDGNCLECQYTVSYIPSKSPGEQFFAAIDLDFSLASLTYPSHLYKVKLVGHTSSAPLLGATVGGYGLLKAWRYNTGSGWWETIGWTNPTTSSATYLWPPVSGDENYAYTRYDNWKHYIDRTNQKCKLRYGITLWNSWQGETPGKTSDYWDLSFVAHVDYVAVECIYNTANRLIQLDPCSIVSHTASVITLDIIPGDDPYNVIIGDGWNILNSNENMLNLLLPYIVGGNATTSGGSGGGCAASIVTTGWTGRKDRLSPPSQIMMDICREQGLHFWIDTDTYGTQLLKISSSWNGTASRVLTTSDINSLYSPTLKIYETKYDGVVVIGARHRYGDQYIDARGEYGETSGTANYKLYRAPHINTDAECRKIAYNLFQRYKNNAEIVTCVLTDSTLAKQIQPGETVDIATDIVGKAFSQIPLIQKHVIIQPAEGVTLIECQFGEVPR